MIPTASKLKRDMIEYRQQGTLDNYTHRVAACMIPAHIMVTQICAFIDIGATISIVSGRVAMILVRTGKAKLEPSQVRAEVFGDKSQPVHFEWQIEVHLSIVGGAGTFKMHVLDGMVMDYLLGDNVVSRAGLILNYEERTVQCLDEKEAMMNRGEVIKALCLTEDLFYLTKCGIHPPAQA